MLMATPQQTTTWTNKSTMSKNQPPSETKSPDTGDGRRSVDMTSLTHLERLARSATPGPWRYDDRDDRIVQVGADRFDSVFSGGAGHEGNYPLGADPADIEYVCAASPNVILQLLADRRELVQALRDALTGWQTCNTTYQHGDATPRFTEHHRQIVELSALAAKHEEKP